MKEMSRILLPAVELKEESHKTESAVSCGPNKVGSGVRLLGFLHSTITSSSVTLTKSPGVSVPPFPRLKYGDAKRAHHIGSSERATS